MAVIDIQQSLQRAEAELRAGRFDSARAQLDEARRAGGDSADLLHLTALVEKGRGNIQTALDAFAGALRLAPNNAQLMMNYANLLQAIGELEPALSLYDHALTLDPGSINLRFNRVLVLTALRRVQEALPEIDDLVAAHPNEPSFHSTRGVILRANGRLTEAADSFDRALALDPDRLLALHGCAQIAKERDEDRASELYRRALSAYPDNGELILGLAETLEAEGRADEAVETLEEAVARTPDWVDGHAALARMRWELKDEFFIRDLEKALAAEPGNGPLWSVLATTLAGADLPLAAAQAASEGVRATAGEPRLQLLEAFLVSEAGELNRADDLFAALPSRIPGREFSEARHALRAHRFDDASRLLDAARAETPWDMAIWAMTSLAWRLTGDPRAEWLNFQPGLVRTLELDLDPVQLERIAASLRTLHRTRTRPLHQSLRGGTQSRGRLFERPEPEIALFSNAVRAVVQHYWNDLPEVDRAHPLLRHRAATPLIEGSWSVRLTDGGYHVPHFHPEGIISSAAYVAVPPANRQGEGWLEIGAAPADLKLPLEPVATVEPRPGRVALFPSYMFHGTRPFTKGERLTAAFDVVAA